MQIQYLHVIQHNFRNLFLGYLVIFSNPVDPDAFDRPLNTFIDLDSGAAHDLHEGEHLLLLRAHISILVKLADKHFVADFIANKRLAKNEELMCLRYLGVYHFNHTFG